MNSQFTDVTICECAHGKAAFYLVGGKNGHDKCANFDWDNGMYGIDGMMDMEGSSLISLPSGW